MDYWIIVKTSKCLTLWSVLKPQAEGSVWNIIQNIFSFSVWNLSTSNLTQSRCKLHLCDYPTACPYSEKISYPKKSLWPLYSFINRPECLHTQNCPHGDLCLKFSSPWVRCLLPSLLWESLWNPFPSEQHPWQLFLRQHWVLLALGSFALELSVSSLPNSSFSLTLNGASRCFMEKNVS